MIIIFINNLEKISKLGEKMKQIQNQIKYIEIIYGIHKWIYPISDEIVDIKKFKSYVVNEVARRLKVDKKVIKKQIKIIFSP